MIPAFADDRQACNKPDRDPEDWFPGRGKDGQAATTRAKAVCADCPIRDACLAYALPIAALVGIWGGTTTGERAALRRSRRLPSRTLYDDFDPHPRSAWQSAS